MYLAGAVLTVFWVALAGWLFYRAIRSRLGVAGNILLFTSLLVLGFTAVHGLVLLNPGPPLRILWWALLVGSVVALAHAVLRILPFPTPSWLAALLGDPLWRLPTLPVTVISRTGLRPGMLVVEVGAGSGRLSVEVARRLLPGGRLICIDIQPEMIRAITTRAADSGIDNIETHVALAERLPAGIAGADLVLFVATIGEVKDKQSALAEALRVLKPGGVLSVSEFTSDPRHCPKDEVKRLAKQAGFEELMTQNDAFGFTANFSKPRGAADALPSAGPGSYVEEPPPVAGHPVESPARDNLSP
ncbi:MAG: methyltransferase domain-containing protein [bacterium]